jgi:hypothetical protein
MLSDLIKSWSRVSIVAEAFEDQVLEFRGEASASNLLPVMIDLALK